MSKAVHYHLHVLEAETITDLWVLVLCEGFKHGQHLGPVALSHLGAERLDDMHESRVPSLYLLQGVWSGQVGGTVLPVHRHRQQLVDHQLDPVDALVVHSMEGFSRFVPQQGWFLLDALDDDAGHGLDDHQLVGELVRGRFAIVVGFGQQAQFVENSAENLIS